MVEDSARAPELFTAALSLDNMGNMQKPLKKYFDFNVMYDLSILEAYTQSFAEFKKHLPGAEKSILMIAYGKPGIFNYQGRFLTFHDPAAIREIGKELYRLIRNDKKWEALRELLRSHHRNLLPVMTIEGMRRLVAGLETDRDMLAAYERMYQTYLDAATAYLFTDGQYHEYSIAEIEKELRRAGRGSIDAVSLLKSEKPSIFRRANLELARIGKLRRARNPSWSVAFERFLDQYVWLFVADTHYEWEEITNGLKQRMMESREDAGSEHAPKRSHRASRIPQRTRTVASRLAELGFERMEFRPFWQWSDFMLHKIFEAFEKKHRLPKHFLAFLTHRETTGLMKQFSRKEVRMLARVRKARMKHFATLLSGGSVRVLHDTAAIERLRKSLCDEGFDGTLKGQVVFPAKEPVTGQARVVPWTKQIARALAAVRRGEILVINQAKPDFLPFIGKVGAIVADEGGITSHSAVICREFRVPSVIGTRVGTSVIRTGDTIRIDFASGGITVLPLKK